MDRQQFDMTLLDISPMDDQGFSAALDAAKNHLGIPDREIEEAFGVSRPTVSRWVSGASLPHPAFRPVVIGWVRQQIAVSRAAS